MSFTARMVSVVTLAFGLTLAACHGPTTNGAGAPPNLSEASGTSARAAVTEMTSVPWGFSTQSYFIEGPTGLIALDTQFLPSEAERMIAFAEARTHKKFELAIVLHANPDKFNGTATFQKHGVRVVTSAAVAKLVPSVHEKRLRAFYERYAPDYPKETPSPEALPEGTRELRAAGLTLKLYDLGPGCSEAHLVVEWEKHVFVGDLVANRAHSWLEIGKTPEWHARLDEIAALGPRFVHPGRGTSGGPELLAREHEYLRVVERAVASELAALRASKVPLDTGARDAALERVKTSVVKVYPEHAYAVFLEIGLPAEWERQVSR